MRPVGVWVCSGSSGSFGYTLVVAAFVLVRLVRPCAPWGLLGSFRLVWLETNVILVGECCALLADPTVYLREASMPSEKNTRTSN